MASPGRRPLTSVVPDDLFPSRKVPLSEKRSSPARVSDAAPTWTGPAASPSRRPPPAGPGGRTGAGRPARRPRRRHGRTSTSRHRHRRRRPAPRAGSPQDARDELRRHLDGRQVDRAMSDQASASVAGEPSARTWSPAASAMRARRRRPWPAPILERPPSTDSRAAGGAAGDGPLLAPVTLVALVALVTLPASAAPPELATTRTAASRATIAVRASLNVGIGPPHVSARTARADPRPGPGTAPLVAIIGCASGRVLRGGGAMSTQG